MKVSINHEESTQGLLFKKPIHAIITEIIFSEEEKGIIRERKLGDYVVMERGWDAKMREKAAQHPDHYDRVRPPHLFVSTLVKGPDTYYVDTPADAKGYEARLVESLKTLKAFIADNSTKAESKSFEL